MGKEPIFKFTCHQENVCIHKGFYIILTQMFGIGETITLYSAWNGEKELESETLDELKYLIDTL